MKKKIIYFIAFLLVCGGVSGYFLGKQYSLLYSLIYFLSVLVGSYLLHKAFPIQYKKEETDDEE